VRHANEQDLDRIADLLAELRSVDGLRERKRGTFQIGQTRVGSRAFLHFHADGDDFYADVRLDGVAFERRRVTSAKEQATLVDTVRAHLSTTRLDTRRTPAS
jgi:hypothetical protein